MFKLSLDLEIISDYFLFNLNWSYFQCLILTLKTLHVIIRYSMHLYDLHHEGVWENRGIYVYYLEFMFEMTILTIDFMHHLHMLVSSTQLF